MCNLEHSNLVEGKKEKAKEKKTIFLGEHALLHINSYHGDE